MSDASKGVTMESYRSTFDFETRRVFATAARCCDSEFVRGQLETLAKGAPPMDVKELEHVATFKG